MVPNLDDKPAGMMLRDTVSRHTTHLVEQIWAVEGVYELQKTIWSHSENTRNVILYSAHRTCQTHLRQHHNEHIQRCRAGCQGHERHIGELFPNCPQASILFAEVVAPFLDTQVLCVEPRRNLFFYAQICSVPTVAQLVRPSSDAMKGASSSPRQLQVG